MLKELNRISSPPLSVLQKDKLIRQSVELIRELTLPIQVILFGSAVNGKFDEYSDLDFVLVFPDIKTAKASRKILYSNSSKFMTGVDFLCVDEKTFSEKSKLGGVYFIAANEGRFL